MFTQCPLCETVFRLSADALGAAGGQVRCGRCGEVFDALKRLSEEPRMFAIGETTLELESRAEQILESSAEPAPAGDGEPDDDAGEHDAGYEFVTEGIASLELQDLQIGETPDAGEHGSRPAPPEHLIDVDRSLEFTLAPAELDRIFIEATPGEPLADDDETLLRRISAEADAAGDSQTAGHLHEPDDLHEPDFRHEPDLRHDGDGLHPVDAGTASAAASARAAGAYEPAVPGPDAARRLRPLWLAAAVLLVLALAAQVVHRNREYLASRPPFGAMLRALYANLGAPLPVPASLSGYQLRQWGTSSDATASGTLRVRASILNMTAQMQPFPLLRVTLADRFGAHMGSREFEPADYLGRPVTRLLGPGERADATVDIQDPGKDAESFELDVCLRSADGKVHCASDQARPL